MHDGCRFGDGAPHLLATPCQRCGHTAGVLHLRQPNGQRPLCCAGCGTWIKWVGKGETGEAKRSVSSQIHAKLRPSDRAAILERDAYHCLFCGRRPPEVILHVAHVVSVQVGSDLGLTEDQINHPDNLITGCEECNLGQRASSPPPYIIASLLARIGGQR
jgi:hypothetical protein